jgi:NAD+ synthase
MLVVGTSDKSEFSIGYFTKWGDGAADILPIGGLYKTQVRGLAQYLKLPKNIISKPSSPGFWKDHLAEKEIGIKYTNLDPILHCLQDLNMEKEEISDELKIPIDRVIQVISMIKKSEHKKKLPPIAHPTP